MNFKLKGHILAVITICIWSSTFIVSKVLLTYLSPLQILFFRFLMSIIFLSILYPRFKKSIDIKEELLFLSTGGCLALYFFFENSALKHTYSSNVSLIVSTIPLITGVLSAIFYKTHFFSKKSLLGFSISYIGVLIIILNGNRLAGIEPIGDFFALVAAIMFAAYTIVMQKIQSDYHIIELTRKVFIYALCVLVIIILVSKDSLCIEEINISIVVSMIFLGIVASSMAFLMWNKSIKIIGSVKTNQYIYLVPVITTIFSAIIIGEKITPITISGAALIISGLYISEKAQETRTVRIDEKVLETIE